MTAFAIASQKLSDFEKYKGLTPKQIVRRAPLSRISNATGAIHEIPELIRIVWKNCKIGNYGSFSIQSKEKLSLIDNSISVESPTISINLVGKTEVYILKNCDLHLNIEYLPSSSKNPDAHFTDTLLYGNLPIVPAEEPRLEEEPPLEDPAMTVHPNPCCHII